MNDYGINESKTKKNVRNFLSSYRMIKCANAAKIDALSFVQSQQYSSTPRDKSNQNNYEHHLVNKLGDIASESKLQAIDAVISVMPKVSGQILYYSYCTTEKYTQNEIAAIIVVEKINSFGEKEEIFYSVKNIERLKAIALIEFAFIYNGGELLVFE